eukprot:Nk52_evm36s32 gene=Nk52_evmTU36s32
MITRGYASGASQNSSEGGSGMFALGLATCGGALAYLYSSGIFSPQYAPKKKVNRFTPIPEIEEAPAAAAVETKKSEKESSGPSETSSPAATPPKEPLKFPSFVPYVLIGAGTASFAAMKSIREKDPEARILIVGEEKELPYMRPPLSKELWYNSGAESWFRDENTASDELKFKDWSGNERNLFFETEDFFCTPEELMVREEAGVAIVLGRKVTNLDVYKKSVVLSNGSKVKFDKCLLATGGVPKNLDVFKQAPKEVAQSLTLFRKISEFKKLDSLSKSAESIAVIGGGFLSSELACALAHRGQSTGLKVTQIFREAGNMGKVFPGYLTKWTTKRVQDEGVEVIADATVDNVTFENGKVQMKLSTGKTVSADHVVVAVGIEPNTALAKKAGLEIDPHHGGILCNAELEARSGIYVAGDVCSFHDVALGRRRVEHHDHAVVSGRLAGENMAGGRVPYWHQSMFWSDLGPKVGYEAIGLVDSKLETFGVWALATEKDTPQAAMESGDNIRSGEVSSENVSEAPETETKEEEKPSKKSVAEQLHEEYGKGVVFYMRDKRVVGVLLWNVFDKIPQARKLIREADKYEDLNQLSTVFSVHK